MKRFVANSLGSESFYIFDTEPPNMVGSKEQKVNRKEKRLQASLAILD